MSENEAVIKHISEKYVSPVLYHYVYWVLKEAQSRKIKTLYFLARDGYVLLEIARRITQRDNINVDCRYLYCSRLSLRTPTYHLIGEEALDLLLLGGYYLTPESVLERAFIQADEREQILKETGYSSEEKTHVLSKAEYAAFSEKLRHSSLYLDKIRECSQNAYSDTIAYLSQEKVLEQETLAIVDSGWTGSMQRSLRQLVQSAGYQGKILGFYFGMFERPKDAADGEYLTWYFDADHQKIRKILFNNNVFECMLSAPHNMTVGYTRKGDRYEPVFSQEDYTPKRLSLIHAQIEGILNGIQEQQTTELSFSEALRNSKKNLSRIMVHPTQEVAETYGLFVFCDDITEGYHLSLADRAQTSILNRYLFVPRLWRRLKKHRDDGAAELFWIYGTIAFLPGYKQWWYRLNVYLWEWIRYS